MKNAHLSSSPKQTVQQASQANYQEIHKFLNQSNLIHQHLDWFSSLDWLGQQPFLFEKVDNQIAGLICASPEVDRSTWLRLFGVKRDLNIEQIWGRLLSTTVSILKDQKIEQLAALGLSSWLIPQLANSGFERHQSIVELEWRRKIPLDQIMKPGIEVRSMVPDDLLAIKHIDGLAFEPLWQNSLEGLQKALKLPGIHTVAIKNNQIVGYQISTTYSIHSHLARLAVHPDHQRCNIGSALLRDLLNKYESAGLWCMTVNTQSDNQPSLGLYKRFGFSQAGEGFPVYLLHL